MAELGVWEEAWERRDLRESSSEKEPVSWVLLWGAGVGEGCLEAPGCAIHVTAFVSICP